MQDRVMKRDAWTAIRIWYILPERFMPINNMKAVIGDWGYKNG
jgi:hypothetical protein